MKWALNGNQLAVLRRSAQSGVFVILGVDVARAHQQEEADEVPLRLFPFLVAERDAPARLERPPHLLLTRCPAVAIVAHVSRPL